MPDKYHSQSSPIWVEIGWIGGCTILQANPKRLPGFFFLLNMLIFIYFFKYDTIETHACSFLTLIIVARAGVQKYFGPIVHFEAEGMHDWTYFKMCNWPTKD